MKVKITRGTVAQGRFVEPGEEIEVSKGEAKALFLCNKAIEVNDSDSGATAAVEVNEEPKAPSRVAKAPHRKVGKPSKTSKKKES